MAIVERSEHLSAHTLEADNLMRALGRFRVRLGFEKLLLYAIRGVGVGAAVAIGLSILAWLGGLATWEHLAWLPALPLGAAFCWGIAHWPANREAALIADRRLVLAERLGTAVEVAERLRRPTSPNGRFDRLQVRDAIDRAREAPIGWLLLEQRSQREVLLACLLVVAGAASLVLPGLPHPELGAPATAPEAARESLAVEHPERIALSQRPDVPLAEAPPPPIDAELASRVQQQLAEREALDRLAQALTQVSAAQPAADALQRGDYAEARRHLGTLGDEADQLSSAAKQQLSKDLLQAASATTSTDRQLAERERQAAQALSRNNYADQRQALRNLADQVERSGARGASAEQLARDTGRLQQEQQQPGAGAGATQPGEGQGGQSGSPGVGSGQGPDVWGDRAMPLESSGQNVQVPTKLSGGPGVRPEDGSESDVGANRSVAPSRVSELAQAQRTGQVAPEQNLVPGEQRPVVRGYFR